MKVNPCELIIIQWCLAGMPILSSSPLSRLALSTQRDAGMEGWTWRWGVGGLLSVVSFSSCMSHPAVSFALFVTPTQLREARLPHTHQYALQSCSPYVEAVHLWHLIYLAKSSPMRLTWTWKHTNLLQHQNNAWLCGHCKVHEEDGEIESFLWPCM